MALADDWRAAPIDARLHAMLDYAVALTRDPAAASPAALDALRDAGLDDAAILWLVEVVAYFNYVNRIASGLGVELEPD